MKWIGTWLSSFVVWLVVAAIEAKHRESHGSTHSDAINEGVRTIKAGMIVTGIVIFGVWCILF
jgi:hypothetical protein